MRAVECKWIFKKKIDTNGNVHIYKARLVAKGFCQIQGVDYDEIFSPVAMLKSIRILIVIAVYYDYEIWQMDVKMAFLNGNLSEDVYMTQLEGFVDPKNARKVCWLMKSIYRLKQASGSALVFLILYVDDILLIGNNIPMLEDVKASLTKSFSMKDLGEASYVLV
jgi:hypothetical protein